MRAILIACLSLTVMAGAQSPAIPPTVPQPADLTEVQKLAVQNIYGQLQFVANEYAKDHPGWHLEWKLTPVMDAPRTPQGAVVKPPQAAPPAPKGIDTLHSGTKPEEVKK